MTEAELLRNVISLCYDYGLFCFHVFDSRKTCGYGYPDLTICSTRNLLFAELKSDFGTLSPDQNKWKYRLTAAGAKYVVWFPRDLVAGTIENVLAGL